MAKEYKIKRSKKGGMLYKPRPHPLKIVLIAILVVGLGYFGFVIYAPIRDALIDWAEKPNPPDDLLPAATEPEEPAQEESSLPERATARTDKLKAVYLPHQTAAGDKNTLHRFLDGLPAGINAVMVDIKDAEGRVLFATEVAEAKAWGAVAEDAVGLETLKAALDERGLVLIARMSAFRDDTASRGNKEIAVQYRSPGVAWLDNFAESGGKRWLNPYDGTAQQYLIDLALDAVDKGAVMVVLSDLQFPPNSLTADAYFGEVEGVTRAGCLSAFAKRITESVEEKDARLMVYLPVSALTAPNITLYGGDARDILAGSVLLGALPYQFPEDYESGGLTIRAPLSNPANTVKEALTYALDLIGAEMVLIQGGNEPEVAASLTAVAVKGQIEAAQALGIEEYILYCTDASGYQLEG